MVRNTVTSTEDNTTENKAVCTVCGNKHPYRKGKRYCSPRCKQKAYVATKRNTTIIASTAETAFDFSLSEFQQLTNEHHWVISVHMFCFLRRGLRKDADLESVSKYMESFYIDHRFKENIENTTAFKVFKEDFFGGKYIVG